MSDPMDAPAMVLRDAPQSLADLLERLPTEADRFLVSQHLSHPQPDEWFSGLGVGDVGPYPTAEDALVAGVAWLVRQLRDAEAEREARAALAAESLPDHAGRFLADAGYRFWPDEDGRVWFTRGDEQFSEATVLYPDLRAAVAAALRETARRLEADA